MLLLGFSSQFSLFNAANFLLFRVIIFWRTEKNCQSVILYWLSRGKKTIWVLQWPDNTINEVLQYWINVVSKLLVVKNKINCPLYFHFSYLYFSPAGNITVYPPSQSTNREKYFQHYYFKVKNADSGGKWTTFPSISSIIGHAFSNFRQKMDGPNPAEMDIKAFIPAPTCCLLYTP